MEAGSLSSVDSTTEASKDEVGKLSAWDERSLAASLGSTAESLWHPTAEISNTPTIMTHKIKLRFKPFNPLLEIINLQINFQFVHQILSTILL